MKQIETIFWDETIPGIQLIDQTGLPGNYRMVRCTTVNRLITAIKRLEVRGAPALGVAGAFGVALAARRPREKDFERYVKVLNAEAARIREARPTAVNLSWGVDRVLDCIHDSISVRDVRARTLDEAQLVAREDAETCHRLGEAGAALLPERCTVLTHCNAGALACREWGTALGVIRSAVTMGKEVKVIACETRPLLQGARLTAWELARDGIDVTVITDSSAAYLMRQGKIDFTIVGADRITRDVVFNKIGTYMHATCAKSHSIPFYVAAPISTFDPDHTEIDITVEERGRDEIAYSGRTMNIPDGVPVINYAFDATPLDDISGIITEKGVLRIPLDWDAVRKHSRKNR
jgi:S-methyl-5-thioribose-1-phosphate isomerase